MLRRGMGSLLFFLIISVCFLYGQDVITAERYLEVISNHYATVRDYEANIVIRSGGTNMNGNVSYLAPSFLRIDFTQPADQVIVFNGDLLTLYLPEFRSTLNQSVNRRSGATGAALASSQGLSMLRRNYIPSYLTGPNPVPLETNSSEMVMKIRLERRAASEGYREIILSINPQTRMIRRVEGYTVTNSLVRFDFTDIRPNVGIPAQRFVFDPPPTATSVQNFLFRDTD